MPKMGAPVTQVFQWQLGFYAPFYAPFSAPFYAPPFSSYFSSHFSSQEALGRFREVPEGFQEVPERFLKIPGSSKRFQNSVIAVLVMLVLVITI